MKICFVSLDSYSLFNRSTQYSFGGSEIRSYLFGVGLSKFPENDVSFVVYNHNQAKVEQYDKVRVYRHSYYKNGIFDKLLKSLLLKYIEKSEKFPLIRFKRMDISLLYKLPIGGIYYAWRVGVPRISYLIQKTLHINSRKITPKNISIYKDIDADIYCSFGVFKIPAEVALFCKKYSKKFVLFISDSVDLLSKNNEGSEEMRKHRNVLSFYHHAINYADLIITQTNTQSKVLWEHFEKPSVTLYNPIELRKEHVLPGNQKKKNFALWVGKTDQSKKRPELLLKLAHIFRDVHFVMVLNCVDLEIYKQIVQNKPVNVEIIKHISYDDIEKLYLNSFVFINTSAFEGFPNTFLQAGKYGVPILSLDVDPDDFIQKNECGIVADGSFDKFVEGFSVICTDDVKRGLFSENTIKYVSTHHELSSKVNELNEILKEVK